MKIGTKKTKGTSTLYGFNEENNFNPMNQVLLETWKLTLLSIQKHR